MITLYSMQSSGNCYKVRLAAAHLGLAMTLVDVDVFRGEHRTPEFLMKNPNGKVPLLELPGGLYLSESNAILVYLAEGTRLMPADPLDRAQVLAWMFFEQYSHDTSIGMARHWLSLVRGGRELRHNEIDSWMERGYEALGVMDRHLSSRPWFGGGRFSIADIALYAHTHVAADGDFDLQAFARVREWLGRVAAMDGHVDMAWRPADAAALSPT